MTPDGKDQVELNEDVIISCYPQCQKGVLFSSKILELDRSASQQVSGNAVVMPEIKVAGPYPIGTACNGDLASKIAIPSTKPHLL
ncbi:MAG: hypothetical protein MRQ09_06660 [Candidatus Midichloria sp.]|nr:hypothetical protein [Candidatus Midichloria sp.]